MKIEIHSFESIEKLAKSPFELRTSLISIGDPDAAPPELKHRPDHILRLAFDDTTLDDLKERYEISDSIMNLDEKTIDFLSGIGVSVFSDEQAKCAAEFVTRYKNETDLLICQCHFGQSRSAGCAAAIAEYFNGNGIEIFADERYSPSKLVYQKVLNALKQINE